MIFFLFTVVANPEHSYAKKLTVFLILGVGNGTLFFPSEYFFFLVFFKFLKMKNSKFNKVMQIKKKK